MVTPTIPHIREATSLGGVNCLARWQGVRSSSGLHTYGIGLQLTQDASPRQVQAPITKQGKATEHTMEFPQKTYGPEVPLILGVCAYLSHYDEHSGYTIDWVLLLGPLSWQRAVLLLACFAK